MHRFIAALLVWSPVFLLNPSAQDRPLPEASALFAAARDNLARAGRAQDQFAYKERRTQIHMNPFGRIGTGGTVLYEVTPISDGPGFTRRVLERDGKPVASGEVEEFGRRRAGNRTQSAIQDAANVLDFRIDRRVVTNGRPAIVVTFRPKPNARPQTRQGRLAQSFAGKIWVDETTHEVTRVEATAIESMSYGFGLLARLGEGTVVTLLRELVDDNIWLPTSIRFQGEGRALLLRKLRIDFGIEWFDYRQLPVSDQ